MTSTSFHEIQFPPNISYGATGGPGFKTTVLSLASGFEKRNIDWSLARAQYDAAHGLKTQEQLNELLKFFYARRGKAYGFRYKDWSDFRAPFWDVVPGDIDPLIALFTTDGATAQFQLFKPYLSGSTTYNRPIRKPVAGTLTLYDNGTPTSDWTVDTTTGIVTLGHTTATTTGHLITGGFEFDVPVRFDTDEMKTSIDDIDNFSWGSITLIEVRQ